MCTVILHLAVPVQEQQVMGCPGHHDPSVAAGIAGAGDREQAYSAEPAQGRRGAG